MKPDLGLAGYQHARPNGFEVAEKIRGARPPCLDLFLSDRSDKNDRLKGFSCAKRLLGETPSIRKSIARIKDRFESVSMKACRRRASISGNTTFNYTTNEIRTGNNKVLITSRQADILRILATNLNLAVDRVTFCWKPSGELAHTPTPGLEMCRSPYLRKALHNDPSTGIVSLPKKGYMLRG